MATGDEEAFWDVVDAYRWLAAAASSWHDIRDGGRFTTAERTAAKRLLPNVTTALQASALVYARALMEFFSAPATRSDDIRSVHFGFQPTPADLKYLVDTKPAIDKHLSHLTEARHPGKPKKDPRHARLDWDDEIAVIADHLVALLRKMATEPSTAHGSRLLALLHAVEARLADSGATWPDELVKPDPV